MPGCLGLDALWQLIGFFLGWKGGLGHGRALGSGEIRFTGQVTPDCAQVRYHVSLKRVVTRKLYMGIGDGHVEAFIFPPTTTMPNWFLSPPPDPNYRWW